VVGYFVNPLVLRARFDRGTTFADAVRAAGAQVAQATAHVSYPYPLLRNALGRTVGDPPLFRIAVTMVTASRFGATLDRLADGEVEVRDGGLRMTPMDVPRLEGQFDLNVEITRAPTSMTLVFRYNTDLFDEATIARVVDAYLRFLEVSVGDPAVRVSRAPLVDPAERARLLTLGTGAVGSVAP
jgi:non-ribosomal peptide synthetase component F